MIFTVYLELAFCYHMSGWPTSLYILRESRTLIGVWRSLWQLRGRWAEGTALGRETGRDRRTGVGSSDRRGRFEGRGTWAGVLASVMTEGRGPGLQSGGPGWPRLSGDAASVLSLLRQVKISPGVWPAKHIKWNLKLLSTYVGLMKT